MGYGKDEQNLIVFNMRWNCAPIGISPAFSKELYKHNES